MLLDERTLEDEHLDRIDRPRLESRLVGPHAAAITVLVGPAGSGKSALIAALRRGDSSALYYRVGNERATFARFVHGIAQAIAVVAPGAQASFPRAWERALQSHSPSIALAHWFCEHLAGIDHQIAIDDLHDAAADPSIASFIGKVAELRPDARLTIAVRTVGALPIALWMATRRMGRPIGEAELLFDRTEVLAAAHRSGVILDRAGIDHLLSSSGGLPIAVTYALTRLCTDPQDFASAGIPASFAGIAERIFARCTGHVRAFLFSALLFASVDDELLARSGWDDAAAIREALGSDAAFMWERNAQGITRFHDRFRDYLAAQFRTRDREFRSTIANRTVESLTAVGRYSDALHVATHERLIGTMGALLDTHGFEILESGEIDVISEALTVFDDPEHTLGASALALRGYMEARSGRLDTAEAWFRLGLDKAHDDASRVAIAMYYARELALRRREDSWEVLAPYADSTTLPRPVLIDVASSYAQALSVAGRLEEACSRTDGALALLDCDSPPALRARVFARAAYVALESGSFALARERALIAAPLAVAQSLYDVAASTYSVLYNIAYEIDDDPVASLEYLRCLRDLGVKSGTLRLDLYALFSMYELYAEAGEENALDELDRELSAVDKHDATTEIMETLLPAKALRAAWSGNFRDAQRLLSPTAERQATPDRKALCWARIALYCAAAGDTLQAAEASAKASETLPDCDVRIAQFGLTLLLLALGAWVNGNVDRARELTRAADDAIASGPRLRALHNLLATMIDGSADTDRFAQGLASALAALRAASFGGMARLVEALPYRTDDRGSSAHTIGSVLAKRELPTRFVRAVEANDATLVRAWLDTVSGSTFVGLEIIDRFDRWSLQQARADRTTQTAIRTVRRQLEAYRRPAPAIARLVDDIDASIETLFEHLDVTAPLMAEHSRAVSAWCSRLARAIGLSEREITFVTRCGLIHDIGKMRTPSAILQAPRQLTADEWAIMRDHAAEGGRIVGHLPLLTSFVPIVRGHHERLDGRGYPDGLRANAIPLAARIVSVADSFNAMIGRRPYRLPLAPTEALGELERHSATQFDPEIVEAMVRVVLGRLGDRSD